MGKTRCFKFNEQEPDVFTELFNLIAGSNPEIAERIIQLSLENKKSKKPG
jgi:hypothetical protein